MDISLARNEPHVHVNEDRCPLCDQPIPNDRAEAVFARFRTLQEQLKRATAEIDDAERARLIENAKSEALRAAQQQIDAARAQAESEQNAAIQKVRDEALASLRQAYDEGMKATQPQIEALLHDKEVHTLEEQRLLARLKDIEGRLENKPPGVPGEEGEVHIFEKLKEKFAGDRIRRVDKGTAGPDIIHDVIDESKNKCGTIVYECKNTKVWSDHYVTKLHENQIAEQAEHAILSTAKLPSECDDEIAIRDGIIIAHPARVPMLAEIMRRDIIENHELRKWAKGADQKKDALYTYITSPSFKQHLESIDIVTREMIDLDTDEEKQHKRTWKKRGLLIKSMQEAEENLHAGIDEAIGAE